MRWTVSPAICFRSNSRTEQDDPTQSLDRGYSNGTGSNDNISPVNKCAKG